MRNLGFCTANNDCKNVANGDAAGAVGGVERSETFLPTEMDVTFLPLIGVKVSQIIIRQMSEGHINTLHSPGGGG